MRVGVIGASGYAGGEVLRLIAGHPDLELAVATADSSAGKPVAEVHQNLAGQVGIGDLVFAPHEAAASAGCDLAFLALPAGASAAAAASLGETVKIVDIGPDFRLADPAAWERHYPGPHAGRWVTGLPELPGARARVRAATRVAAPGCYATASILALAPMVGAGLVAPDDIVIVAESGTSGAGRSLRANLLASEVMGSVSAYQVGGLHRHIPEIEQALSEVAAGLTGWGADPADLANPPGTAPDGARVCFTPVLAPMPRGILATCTARLASPGTGTADLRAALTAAYAGEPFVTVLPEGRWPATAAVAGSNGVQVQVTADVRSGRAVVVAAIDNLGKGAAGQAVQNANLMLGLPETAGLTAMGVAP